MRSAVYILWLYWLLQELGLFSDGIDRVLPTSFLIPITLKSSFHISISFPLKRNKYFNENAFPSLFCFLSFILALPSASSLKCCSHRPAYILHKTRFCSIMSKSRRPLQPEQGQHVSQGSTCALLLRRRPLDRRHGQPAVLSSNKTIPLVGS